MDVATNILQVIRDSISIVFFLVVLSYYGLFFLRPKKEKPEKQFRSITIIIPCHNEERYIRDCVRSVQQADFPGPKQIIVINDGSSDRTGEILETLADIEVITTAHIGKAASVNLALQRATGELVALLDGDTEIEPNALVAMAREAERKDVAVVTCAVKVKNRNTHVLMWMNIEILYGSLLRLIETKVNANVVAQGNFVVYRTDVLVANGGLSTTGLSDDIDSAIRVIRRGYKFGYCEDTSCSTNIPDDILGLYRQRSRWIAGILNVLVRHMKFNSRLIDLYTMPLMVFGFVQALFMGSFALYEIGSGYWTYFASKGVLMSWDVMWFLFDWVSVFGLVKWSWGLFTGSIPATPINLAAASAGLLTYPLFLYAILKFDRPFTYRHLLFLMFMAPHWWCINIYQICSLPQLILGRGQRNIWVKNEPFGRRAPQDMPAPQEEKELVGARS